MNIISFNILAPIYTHEIFYPNINPELLKTNNRLKLILKFIKNNKNQVDLFCFQETTESIYPYLVSELGSDFTGFIAYNEPSYWSNWIIPPIKYEKNGPSIFLNKSRFNNIKFSDIKLKTGNHTALASCQFNSKKFNILSVHLDFDGLSTRESELFEIISLLNNTNNHDLIIGDLNNNIIGNFQIILDKNNFQDLLKNLNIIGQTIPKFNHNIDHILYRSPDIKPAFGKIIDFDISEIPDPNKRMEKALQTLGSDHYPIFGKFEI